MDMTVSALSGKGSSREGPSNHKARREKGRYRGNQKDTRRCWSNYRNHLDEFFNIFYEIVQ